MNIDQTEVTQEFKATPMMSQWHACKKAAGNAILFFRMGDFYEAFYEDAVLLSKELDLTLTRRQEIPMSGVPHHTCENYIDKLVGKGFKVAIAEQTEDPKKAKGLVKREVVRVVTPGTLINSSLLSENANNYISAIHRIGSLYGLSYLDLTTAEFYVIEFEHEQELLNEIFRLRPSEIVTSRKFHDKHPALFEEIRLTYEHALNCEDDWHFEFQTACDLLLNHFGVHHLDGFGLRGMVPGINAAGALLRYLQEALCLDISHIKEIRTYSTSEYMALDRITLCNLELTESIQDGSRKNTVLSILDNTQTPMGARLMRHWIKQPLLSVEKIALRQDAIQALYRSAFLEHLSGLLDKVRDVERLIMKIATGYASPRDLIALRASFEPIPEIKSLLSHFSAESSLLNHEMQQLDPLPEMNALIERALVEDPPARVTDGKVFRAGFHQELDELREISQDSKSWIARYQAQLREQTGIKTLKVGFTRMFGYYIEVSKGQTSKMPEQFERRQTLVNAERYITPELKSYEYKVLTAEERSSAIEIELFALLRQEISKFSNAVLKVAQAIACIDVLHGLAKAAVSNNYSRPIVDDTAILEIVDGRHPVIERIHAGEKFVPNDAHLDDQSNRLLVITGPNMAGKSTYIRQVALIVIMAQIGSFVPAKSARIGLIDRVFTRIGASDNLSRGQSTFMVEMSETANILHHATSRSLVILDEIGRGTSTYDGISIAWAVAEHLLSEEKTVKTLFATHYWELTKLEEKIPGAVNYHVAVHEAEDQVIFLRKIVQGSTDKSYGIHVGRLAGLPNTVIARAKEILVHLEENANRKSAFEPSKPKRVPPAKSKVMSDTFQLTLFG